MRTSQTRNTASRSSTPARETVDCYNCGSSAHEFFLSENGFDLVKCTSCGVLYIRDRPTEESIEVATVIGEHQGEKKLDVNVRYNHAAARFYDQVLADLFPNGIDHIDHWLDIGCGYGEFLQALKRYSQSEITVLGSEPNAVKQAAARSIGLDVSFIDLGTHDRRYKSVSVLNVYSHLANPFSFFEGVKQVVEPGGLLLIQTGDVSDLDPKSFLRPAGLPDHLTFTSEDALCSMVSRLGFTVENVMKYPSLPATPSRIAREVAKAFLPGKESFLRHYLNSTAHKSKSMFVLARLGSANPELE